MSVEHSSEAKPRAAFSHLGQYVYGSISVLAVIGGLSLDADRLHPPTAAAVIIVGAIAIWLAHTVADVIGGVALQRAHVSVALVLSELRVSLPIVVAAVPPTVILAASAAGAFSVATALSVGNAVSIAGLAVVGCIVGWRIGSRRAVAALAYAAGLTLVGLLIVALELAAHV